MQSFRFDVKHISVMYILIILSGMNYSNILTVSYIDPITIYEIEK